MKTSILLLTILTVNSVGQASETLSLQREKELSGVLIRSDSAKSIVEFVENKYKVSNKDIDPMLKEPTPVEVDCAKRPTLYGSDLAEGYCEITTVLKYGWRHDPLVAIKITGYIKKDKIHAGVLEIQTPGRGHDRYDKKDLTITSVDVQTPLKTGLE